MQRVPLLSCLVFATLTVGACAPNTIIRRTALINAPQSPTREGQPLDRGDVRLEGHVSGANTGRTGSFFFFEPGVAEVGDPGVLIPDFQLGASVWAGLPAGLEFGGQIYYASMGWSEPNLNGVLPFPAGREEDLLMGGLGLRVNIDVDDPRLKLAVLTELNIASIPEAIFVCNDSQRCDDQQLSTNGEELYRFERVDHETFFLPNVALQFGWRFNDARDGAACTPDPQAPERCLEVADTVRLSAMPYLLLGVQESVTNTGFEPDFSTLQSDSLKGLWMGYLGFGVDAVFDKLVVGASLIIPIEGERAIDFGAVFNFKLGVEL